MERIVLALAWINVVVLGLTMAYNVVGGWLR
jgi:hypothetical protein